jgi:hypothetical protein
LEKLVKPRTERKKNRQKIGSRLAASVGWKLAGSVAMAYICSSTDGSAPPMR